jgi:cytochrome c-type biogenesis protein
LEVQVSFAVAFAAGLVSVLSACILPVVPGYVAFVTALTLDELAGSDATAARRGMVAHAVLFMVGFGLVFLSLGLVATRLGPVIVTALPWLQRGGGVLLAVYGLHLLGVFALVGLRAPELGVRAARPARAVGSLATGVAFGAGWTPCIGPVLGSILLYATWDGTKVQGGLLLWTYALGLSLPFIVTAVGLTWPLAGSRSVGGRVVALRRLAGGVLVALGVALVTGYFARLTAFLAGLGQLINLEL